MLTVDPAFDYFYLRSNQIVFQGPTGQFVIADKAGLIRGMLEALDAGEPVDTALAHIDPPEQRGAIEERILGILSARGVVKARAGAQPSAATDPLCDWLGFVGASGTAGRHVAVEGEGLLANALRETLDGLGLSTDGQAGEAMPDLTAFCQDHEDSAALRRINADLIEAGVPLLPVRVHRHVITLGPVIVPGATACAECVHHRTHMAAGREGAGMLCEGPVSVSGFAARLAALMAAEEISRFVFGAAYDLHVASVTRHSVLTGKRTVSVALKVPRCPVCGAANGRRPQVNTFNLARARSPAPHLEAAE